MKRVWKCAAALFVAGCLCVTCAASVFAQGIQAKKEENVYVTLAGDGSVEQVYVVNLFTLDQKTTIQDHGNYSAVRNLTSEEEIRRNGDVVTVLADAGTFYYQGNLEHAQIPWTVTLRYTLDGKSVTADQLAGANGHLILRGSVTRNEQAAGNFFDAYLVQVTVVLDTVKCRTIRADGATAANISTNKQLSYMKLPGQELHFTIEADVTDFSMEGISLNAVPFAMEIEKPDLTEMNEEIDALQSGARELDDGANTLAKEANSLNDGAAQLQSGIGAVASGAAGLVDGANALNDGAASLSAGANELYGGLSLLSAQSGTLQEGAGTIFDSLLAAANTQLQSTLSAAGLPYTPLTQENYNAVLDDLRQQIGGAALEAATQAARVQVTEEVTAAVQEQVEQQVVQAVRAQIEAEVRKNEQQIRDGVTTAVRAQIKDSLTDEQILAAAYAAVCADPDCADLTEEQKQGAAAQLVQQSGDALRETAADTVLATPEVQQQIGAQVEAEVQNLVDAELEKAETQALIAQQTAGQMAGDTVQGLIAMNVETTLASDAVQSQIAAAVEQAITADSAVIQPLNTLATQLTGFDAFYQGLMQYTSGVDQAAAGAARVKDGASALQNGASQAAGGAAQLQSGVQSLQSGAGSLVNGTEQLVDGAKELSGGTGELRTESDGMNGKIDEQIDAILDGLTGGDCETGSFVSEKNTNVTAVQFVMTTPAIERQEPPAPAEEEAPTLTWWQRLLNLFQ